MSIRRFKLGGSLKCNLFCFVSFLRQVLLQFLCRQFFHVLMVIRNGLVARWQCTAEQNLQSALLFVMPPHPRVRSHSPIKCCNRCVTNNSIAGALTRGVLMDSYLFFRVCCTLRTLRWPAMALRTFDMLILVSANFASVCQQEQHKTFTTKPLQLNPTGRTYMKCIT